MSAQPDITQRDLRTRSKEIMDAVANGSSFTVTRGGQKVGQLVPMPRRRRFLPAEEFTTHKGPRTGFNPDALRAELDTLTDTEPRDPYA